jgi:hypothetical protein
MPSREFDVSYRNYYFIVRKKLLDWAATVPYE